MPTIEEAKRATGMSESELERRFLEHLIQQGKNPFQDMPEHFRRQVEIKHPDLFNLAQQKFGKRLRAEAQASISPPKVPRNWDNLPSMVMTPVPKEFSYPDLVHEISVRSPDKQLVCLVAWGWTTSQEQAFQHIEQLYDFADDPKLVLMRYVSPTPGGEQLIIRATFLRDTVREIQRTTMYDLAESLSQLARGRGLHTKALS